MDKFLNPDKLNDVAATIAAARDEVEAAFKGANMSEIFSDLVKTCFKCFSVNIKHHKFLNIV